MEHEQSKQPRSGLAIAGLVLGIIALLTSLLPIINNMSFFCCTCRSGTRHYWPCCLHAR